MGSTELKEFSGPRHRWIHGVSLEEHRLEPPEHAVDVRMLLDVDILPIM